MAVKQAISPHYFCVCQSVLAHLKQPRDTPSESVYPWIWSQRGAISPAPETQPFFHETQLLFNSSEQQAEGRKWRIMSPLETANYTSVDLVFNFPVIIGYTILCILLVLRFSSGFILGCSLFYVEVRERPFSTPTAPCISLSPDCQYSCTFSTRLVLVRMERHTCKNAKKFKHPLDKYYQLEITSLQTGENWKQQFQ